MLIWINGNTLTNRIDLTMDTKSFAELTGKQIELSKYKSIIIERSGGHLHIFGRKFFVGDKYKYNKKKYKCRHIDKSGIAVMERIGNQIEVVTSINPLDWEII